MDFLEIVYRGATIVTVVCVVWHMNAMKHHTPWLEVAAWWCLGFGTFFDLVANFGETSVARTAASIGVMLLTLLHSQPIWRAAFADRRRLPEPPPAGDRRRPKRTEERQGDIKEPA